MGVLAEDIRHNGVFYFCFERVKPIQKFITIVPPFQFFATGLPQILLGWH